MVPRDALCFLAGVAQRVQRGLGMKKALESIGAAAQIGVHVLLGPVLHRWRARWGATDVERSLRLPGDEIVAQPEWGYDHAVTIHTPRAFVWPWLLQFGQGRGGFYSYEGLENLVGCEMHNVLEVEPKLQTLRVGDRVRLHASGFGPEVMMLEPERALVLGGPANEKGSQATWSFYLLDGVGGTTRLLERGRGVAGRGVVEKLGFGPYLMDPVGFVMSKKMLKTIKQLSEHSFRDEPWARASRSQNSRFVF
jgi:hypothetical protein